MTARKMNESSTFGMTITDDGTDAGKVIGNMSATVNNGNPQQNDMFCFTASLISGATRPADSVIQQQMTDFIEQARKQAAAFGLTAFGTAD